MEKQIFIPESFQKTVFRNLEISLTNQNLLLINVNRDNDFICESIIIKLIWLGILNQFLGNKANAKEIVSVEQHNTGYDDIISMDLPSEDDIINGISDMSLGELEHITNDCLRNGTKGYLITYLESEMIASKDDLENAWNAGNDEGTE